MSDVERRLGDFLRAEAEVASVPTGMSQRVLRGARIHRMVTLGAVGVGVAALVAAGVMTAGAIGSRSPARIDPVGPPETTWPETPPPETPPPETPPPSSEPLEVRGGCHVTTPGEGFVPPEPYPSRPPDLYDREWYGDAGLWTWLGPQGDVWRGLPDDDGDGKLTEKLFLWSGDHSLDEPLTLTVRGNQLDGPGSFEMSGPGGGGFREDIGRFMLVGLEILPGCWEMAATYGDEKLSWVILVEG